MKTEIIIWIEQQQKGNVGIYPYRLSMQVASKFNISISEAVEYVKLHIRAVSQQLTTN